MFSKDFVWGVASSAYQIEGRDINDGAGECIWDVFARNGGTFEGQNGDIACDHIHRYKEDFAMMRLLGIKAYRFSISWARIMPEGTGKVNDKAIKLYRDMIICMKENGIEPYITMYHWELPQALQDKGGWQNRDIAEWFGEYARIVAENFTDIAKHIITLNEPQCFVGIGHLSGFHAPGLKLSPDKVFVVAHNALRAHGMAVINLRKYAKQPIKIGYAPTCGVAYPYSESKEDIEAARSVYFGFDQPIDNWTWNVSWFTDPVVLGHYPKEGLEKFKEFIPEFSKDDMELINQPLDFLGQNIYNGYVIKMGKDNKPEYVDRPAGYPKTATNWPVTPECLYWGARYIYERYKLPLFITENGMGCHDQISADGRVHDSNRIDFLDKYISQLQRACDEGIDVKGYFLWTFLDNFEWDKGYNERFGLVHVDFTTQKRIAKDSAYWYQKVIETNGEILSVNNGCKEEILYLNPIFKQMIWGGDRLKTEWGYDIPGDNTGECWGVSAHPNGDCTIKDGTYGGQKLGWLWKTHPEIFGNVDGDVFPLLIKIIDAKADLSIQVHPDDKYAAINENGSLGKTECWYILDATDNATLVIGHNAKDKAELDDMVRNGRWKDFIREISVKKGDFIQIEPGTVHAIKGGIEILETQQNCDITYRVYDYDRLQNGKPRKLHIDKSLDVITVPAKSADESVISVSDCKKNSLNKLIECKYYKVWKLDIDKHMSFEQTNPFMIMSVISGDGLINGQFIKKGDHFILPYGYGKVDIQGKLEIIASAV